jgi:hypothetical protein
MRITPRLRPFALSGLLASLSLTGCAHRRASPPLSGPPPVPLTSTDVDGILSALRSQENGTRRAQGIVGARGRGPEGGFDARLVLIFERPSRLRVELLGVLGGARWSAVASDGRIEVYFPGGKRYLDEPNVSDVVERLLGLRLEPREVMAILAGVGLPLEEVTVVRGGRRGASSFLSIGEDPAETLEVSSDGQVVRAATSRYRVSYPTPWKRRGRQTPDEVVIENDEIRTTLTTDDLDVNVPLDPEAFELEIPADAVRLRPAEVNGEAVFVIQPPEQKHRDEPPPVLP